MNNSDLTLRLAADNQQFTIGAAVQSRRIREDGQYRETLAREFNSITAEYEMKFRFLQPEEGRFDFSRSDELVDFAAENDMSVRGHTLVWHIDIPGWIENGNHSRQELLEILETHIKTVVSRYKGQIEVWDVVNEAIADDGTLRDTFWLREIGPEYINLAFQWAHEADPDAVLVYNDYAISEINRKSNAVYDLVKDLQADGVPIHGVGSQAHLREASPPDFDNVARNIQRFGDLGLDYQFTEVDVRIQQPFTDAKLNNQREIYRNVIETCLEADNCDTVVTWGITDRYSWIPGFFNGFGEALPFDENYQPKPAFDGILNGLLEGQSESPSAPTPEPEIGPTITTPAAVTISENETLVLDINSTDDVDSDGNGLTYELSNGGDANLFSINNEGVLSFNEAPDFETPGDAGRDNTYNVEVSVTDSDNLTINQALSITVSDISEVPDTPPVVETPDAPPVVETPDAPPAVETPDTPPVAEAPDAPPVIIDEPSPIEGDNDSDTIVLDLGDGNNSIRLTSGNHMITAGSGNDNIGLGTGVDIVNAGDGNNVIYTTDYNGVADGSKDILTGSGNDRVKGGSGDDYLDLGTAQNYDVVFGRGGSDIFALNQGSGYVIIRDFEQGTDMLEIGSLSFDDLEQSTRNGKTWISTGGDTLAELTYFTGSLTAEDFTVVG